MGPPFLSYNRPSGPAQGAWKKGLMRDRSARKQLQPVGLGVWPKQNCPLFLDPHTVLDPFLTWLFDALLLKKKVLKMLCVRIFILYKHFAADMCKCSKTLILLRGSSRPVTSTHPPKCPSSMVSMLFPPKTCYPLLLLCLQELLSSHLIGPVERIPFLSGMEGAPYPLKSHSAKD